MGDSNTTLKDTRLDVVDDQQQGGFVGNEVEAVVVDCVNWHLLQKKVVAF